MKTPVIETGAVSRRFGDKTSGMNLRAAARRIVCGLLAVLLLGLVNLASATGVAISGGLHNFDVRYPNTLPNDLEVVVYGPGLTVNDVIGTFFNSQWGQAQPPVASVGNDPTSPGFGLNCITVRWAGPPLPALIGQMLHFGVTLRIGAAAAHQEVWWTINGIRIPVRPCDPHITWICTRNVWLICIANPTPVDFYVYGCRWFPVATTSLLPTLQQLNTGINPTAFGATGWVPLSLPGGQQVFCIPKWCRIYLQVPVISWRPIVFQIGARNVPGPLPPGITGPDPADPDTMAILTTRASQEFAEDINSSGAVNIGDFNQWRARNGAVSQDQAP